MQFIDRSKLDQIFEAIHDCRSVVLYTCEFELGSSSNWESIRARILRAFGNKGLTGRVTTLLSEGKSQGGEQ